MPYHRVIQPHQIVPISYQLHKNKIPNLLEQYHKVFPHLLNTFLVLPFKSLLWK